MESPQLRTLIFFYVDNNIAKTLERSDEALTVTSVKPRGSGETTSHVSTEANEIFTASASQRENNTSVPYSVPATSDWFYKEQHSTKDDLDSILEIPILSIFN